MKRQFIANYLPLLLCV